MLAHEMLCFEKNCFVLDHKNMLLIATKPNIWYNFISVHMAADKTIEIKSNSVILEVLE